jgi:hypothetical protein
MADDKELIKKLFKIAENQQKIITKLAQTLPNKLEPGSPTKKEALSILSALPPAVRAVVDQLEVHQGADANDVRVRFVAGKSSPQAFNAIQKTVQDLQTKNVLAGLSYKITEVA